MKKEKPFRYMRKYVRQKTITVRIRLTPELPEEMLGAGEEEGLTTVTLHHYKGVSSFLRLCFFGSYF